LGGRGAKGFYADCPEHDQAVKFNSGWEYPHGIDKNELVE
jgi:hypothetical protein